MNKSCFLAPIHSAKFNYALNLIRSYNEFFDDDHFYLVFASEDAEKEFKNLDNSLKFRSIIYEHRDASPDEGIISLKKFYGLKKVFDTTDFNNVAVIDVDTLFIKYKNYDELFERYNSDITLYSNKTNAVTKIIVELYNRLFNETDREKIKGILSGNKYFWWNEIPIYDRKKYLEFYDYLDIGNKFPNKLTIHDFDYIIYVYFLFVKDYAILEVLDIHETTLSFLEEQDSLDKDLFSKLFNSYNPMWIKRPINDMKNVFMLMHKDKTQ
jgi:hypothetical protein